SDCLTARDLNVATASSRCKSSIDGLKPSLQIHSARVHNLKNISVRIPYASLTVVTGVSGSGKSSLVSDVLRPNMESYLALPERLRKDFAWIGCDKITGADAFVKTIVMDDGPIGRSSRSNALTYTGAFNYVRELFAATPAAKARGYTASRFSFNVKGGRCEVCKGDGEVSLEMSFLPEVSIKCPQCNGLRFNKETLEIRYAGRNIAEILALTVEEAVVFFAKNAHALTRKLRTLETVGLGYLQLGQSAATLSGGEAQRLQLANELSRPPDKRALYILDEPTAGLHPDDVQKLLKLLFHLRDLGHTIVVVEHNLDIIRSADWLIDLGPEGGAAGGSLIAQGPPALVAESALSHTARYL
ncbi:MAG: ATP-binding cassette domain-containing protein, partial [Kiritimatiellaeota bacterium]|nr:ATP-binding cassette domain-containing protein [Kiritimatiellota bacterium]